ncbi:hypothetical protein [Oceanobacillus sp. CF4.6]|uniref:hypothetical protein n=1 Tax=Oceanobacillus sp. CF4.6 TaxID=3373080 RepID=UPI003EE5BD1A
MIDCVGMDGDATVKEHLKTLTGQVGSIDPIIHYMSELYNMVEDGVFNPTDIITHRISLSYAAQAYEIFNAQEDNCIKVVLKP